MPNYRGPFGGGSNKGGGHRAMKAVNGGFFTGKQVQKVERIVHRAGGNPRRAIEIAEAEGEAALVKVLRFLGFG